MENIALVVGATGITGSNLAEKLIAKGWTTFGLARNPRKDIENLQPVAADLLDLENLKMALENEPRYRIKQAKEAIFKNFIFMDIYNNGERCYC